MMIKVLFVCTANICRSPTAQVLFQSQVEKAGLGEFFDIDSAGTYGGHSGAPPDLRSQATAKKHNIHMDHLRSKQIHMQDFTYFDYIIVMDQSNYDTLLSISPPSLHPKIALLLSYAPSLNIVEVPDPYAQGPEGFEKVFDLIRQGTAGLLEKIIQDQSLKSE